MAKSESSDPTGIDPVVDDDLIGAGEDDDFQDDGEEVEEEA